MLAVVGWTGKEHADLQAVSISQFQSETLTLNPLTSKSSLHFLLKISPK